MGVVGLLGLLFASFAILSASVSAENSPSEYSAADGAAPTLVLEMERLKQETARLKGKLEDVGVTEGDEKTGENATLKWTKEVTTENTSTAISVNAPAWELGGQTAFNVSQALGGWQWIEVFEWGFRPFPDPCEEFIFNLTGSTVERTWRSGKSGDKDDGKANYTLDSQSRHQWTSEDGLPTLTYTWVTTDYANWAVLMDCLNNQLSSCFRLHILSRERTLPPATLEMLRNVGEQRGFSRANGVLVDQTSC